MPTVTRLIALSAILMGGGVAAARAQQSAGAVATHHQSHDMPGMEGHTHGAAVPAVTFAELEQVTHQLSAAREATEKYRDVRTAEAAGYRPVGPDVPGMGIHYVRDGGHGEFSIAEPPILLYERAGAAQSGLRLVGLSYLLVAPAGADGQPVHSPFPPALASWHKHNNVCVLPDDSASINLSESQCKDRKGRFTVQTSWMVHAWIWKESPTGVFSSTNPSVK